MLETDAGMRLVPGQVRVFLDVEELLSHATIKDPQFIL